MTDYLTRLAAALDGAGTDPMELARIAAGVSRWVYFENGYAVPDQLMTHDWLHRIGKRKAGRLLNGREWNEVST